MTESGMQALADAAFAEVPDRLGRLCDQFGLGRDAIVEQHLVSAIVAALNDQSDSDSLLEYRCPVAGWSPAPGPVDIALRDKTRTHLLLIEAKWCNDNKVCEVLWDALKLACIAPPEGDSILRLLAFAASRKRHWDKQVAGSRYFLETHTNGETLVSTRDFLFGDPASWNYLLGGGKARPGLVPTALRFKSRQDPHLIRIMGDPFELYVVSVEPAGSGFWDVESFTFD